MNSVLNGVRVIDLSWGIAGPITGMLLADHGADVVKIEPPAGDPFRNTPGYAVWQRGKRSAVLDLADPLDHERLLALVRTADVVVESFGPGTAERLGVAGPDLLQVNPRLVHCTISAYGDHAGLRDRPGYDALVAARTGIWHEQRGHLGGPIPYLNGDGPYLEDLEIPEGMAPGAPRSGPIFTYTPWLSMGAAFNATTGISAALFARERTGRGQHVRTSLLQAALSITASKWMRAEHSDQPRFRTWTHDRRAGKGFFRCADGRWIQQWVQNPRFISMSAQDGVLQARTSAATMRDDPARIGTEPENLVVLAHYYPEMIEAMARFPSDDWVRVAAEAGVPLQPVRTPEEALRDPALEAEGAVADVEHPEHGTLRQVGVVYGLSATPGRAGTRVPRPGEHTAEVHAEADLALRTAAPPPEPLPGGGAGGNGPLDGVVVLDLGFAVAGPFGTQVLADLGATVIKINVWRDPFWHANHIAHGANRGKRSVGIDLKTPEGLAVLHRLLERADVVHSNMRRDALRRLRCDEESLRRINPEIVYCHTRGFDRGPRSDAPGNDQTGMSLAGATFEDGGCRDGGTPFWSPTSLGDTGNGFLSAIAVIQALYHRRRTGQAQSVDTSILNAGMLVSSFAAVKEDGNPLPRPQLDRMQLGLGPLYRLYRTGDDGWICLAVLMDAEWVALLDGLGHPAWAQDARFADAAARSAHAAELAAHLESEFASRSAADAFAALDAAGVPCEIADESFCLTVHDDPEMQRNELVVRQEHPKLGRFDHFGRTIDFSDTPGRIFGPPPLCGQHTREVLLEHGYDDATIDDLIAKRAVFEELWVE